MGQRLDIWDDAGSPLRGRVSLSELGQQMVNTEITPVVEGGFADSLNIDIHNLLNTSLLTFNGNQYNAYLNDSVPAAIVLAKRTGNTGAWSTDTLTGKTLVDNSDAHDDVGMGIDETGILHIAGMTHHESLYYFKMPNPESISGSPGANISMLGTNETAVTYPVFFNNAAGELYFMFRAGISGDGDHYVYKYNASSQTWAAAPGTSTAGILTDGLSDNQNSYVGAPYVDNDTNIAHFAFSWKDQSNKNHKVHYVAYHMTEGEFKKADGSPQTLPIRESNADEADDVGIDEGASSFIQIRNCGPLPNGNPVIAFQKNDAFSNTQLHAVTHNGSSWNTPVQITSGPASASANTSGVFTDKSAGKTYIMYSSPQLGPPSVHVSETDDNGVSWKTYALTEPGFGVINFKYADFKLWDSSKEINALFIPNSYRGQDTEAESTSAKPLNMLKWKPSELAIKRITSSLNNSSPHGYVFDSPTGNFLIHARQLIFTGDRKGGDSPFGGRVFVKFFSDTATGPVLFFDRARGHHADSSGLAGEIVQDDDILGAVTFRAHDGTYTDVVKPDYITCASVQVRMDGTPSSTSLPTKMLFRTTDVNSVVVETSLTISPDGSVICNRPTGAFFPPSLTTTEETALGAVANGAVIYNETTGKLRLRAGGAWETVTSA